MNIRAIDFLQEKAFEGEELKMMETAILLISARICYQARINYQQQKALKADVIFLRDLIRVETRNIEMRCFLNSVAAWVNPCR